MHELPHSFFYQNKPNKYHSMCTFILLSFATFSNFAHFQIYTHHLHLWPSHHLDFGWSYPTLYFLTKRQCKGKTKEENACCIFSNFFCFFNIHANGFVRAQKTWLPSLQVFYINPEPHSFSHHAFILSKDHKLLYLSLKKKFTASKLLYSPFQSSIHDHFHFIGALEARDKSFRFVSEAIVEFISQLERYFQILILYNCACFMWFKAYDHVHSWPDLTSDV